MNNPATEDPAVKNDAIVIDKLPVDNSIQLKKLTEAQWSRLSDQRDKMIDAMIKVFTWLNGGVYFLVVAAWIGGLCTDYQIVDGQTIMALIGATVVQAGIAFVAITRFLFPGNSDPER